MNHSSNTAARLLAWASIVVIGIVTTAAAIWLISQSQITFAPSWAKVLKHPGFIAGAAVTAMLPWWVMAFSAMEADKARTRPNTPRARKGPVDLVDIMLEDRHRHEKH